MRDQTDCSLNHRCTPGKLYLMPVCVCVQRFLPLLLYCILLEHQSFRTISPILAQFSAFWKKQCADCTNTRLTDTQTPRQAPPRPTLHPSTPPRASVHGHNRQERPRRADGSAAGACARVTCLFFVFFSFLSLLSSALCPSPLPPWAGHASSPSRLKCHLFTIATGLN